MATACPLVVLRRRADFLAVAAAGSKWITPAFIIQCAAKPSGRVTEESVCYGLTATKKIGNAVRRNRARRRLRALAQEVFPFTAKPGIDYVIIARTTALEHDFQAMRKDLHWALRKLGASRQDV